MTRSTLLVGVGGALGGLGVFLAMVAIVYQPFLLLLALPFGASGYLIWYQGTGRMARRMRRRAARETARRAGRGDATGGREARAAAARRRAARNRAGGRSADADDGPRWTDPGFHQQRRRAREAARGEWSARRGGRSTGGTARGSTGGTAAGPGPFDDGMGVEEAYRVLGVSPDDDPDAIKEAYRSKVKEVHPDADGGDEEQFKRVKEAYETLDERVL